MVAPARTPRWVVLAPLTSGLGALGLLVATLHPSLPGGDAGELAAAACAGGVAHPPGYPLHGLLLRAVLALPLGAPLWRLNLSSALCGAVAVGLLVDVVRRWAGRLDAGLLAGALWLVSPLPWRYATTLEVFSLNAALVAFVAWAVTRDVEAPTRRTGLALGAACGLALANHHTAVFVVAPALALRAWRHPARGRVVVGALLGLTPYLALPWWSRHATPFSWGDASTLSGFLTHALRREYGTFRLASDGEGTALSDYLGAFASFEGQQLLGAAALLALIGAAWAWRRSRPWTITGLAVLALSVPAFGALVNLNVRDPLLREVVSRFFLLPHLALCAAGGLALCWRPPRSGLLAVPAAVVLLGATQAPSHDASSVQRYGEWLLDQPADALVLTQGDLIGGATRALQACEGAAPGLVVLDQQLLSYDWYVARLRGAFPGVAFPGARWHPRDAGAFTLDHLLAAHHPRPVVVCGGLKPGDVTAWQRLPDGMCERLVPPGTPVDDEAWFLRAQSRLPPLEATNAAAAPGSWEFIVRRDAWGARAQLGLFALTRGIARGDDEAWLRRAYALLEACTRGDEAPSPAVWKNLGIAAGRLARVEPAMQDVMRRALRRYVELAPASDPELPVVRALVQQP